MSFASAALLALALGPGDLDAPELTAVLPIEGTEMTEARSDLVLRTVRAALESDTLVVIGQDHVTTLARERGPSCAAEASCRSELATELRARFLVRVVVDEPKESDFDVRLEVYEPKSAKVVASFDETCTICSEADLKRIVHEQSLDARLAVERHLAPPVEEATPADPVPVREAPPPVEIRVAKPSPLTLAGWGLVGAGAAAAVGGVVLLGMQGSQAGCPEDPRGGECLPLVYRTVVPGSVTLAAGVAIAATGVGLVFAGRRQAEKRAATARLVPTGSGVLISGRF